MRCSTLYTSKYKHKLLFTEGKNGSTTTIIETVNNNMKCVEIPTNLIYLTLHPN